jgi:hypothetical protein
MRLTTNNRTPEHPNVPDDAKESAKERLDQMQ